MKFETIKKENGHIEVTPPCFVKFHSQYTKILSETDLLVVQDWSFMHGIEICPITHHNPFLNEGWQFITEEEFDAAHEKVARILNPFRPIVNPH